MGKKTISVKGMDEKLWFDFRTVCLQERKTITEKMTEILYIATTKIRKQQERRTTIPKWIQKERIKEKMEGSRTNQQKILNIHSVNH